MQKDSLDTGIQQDSESPIIMRKSYILTKRSSTKSISEPEQFRKGITNCLSVSDEGIIKTLSLPDKGITKSLSVSDRGIVSSLSFPDVTERRNHIPSQAPSTLDWIIEEPVEHLEEQDLNRLLYHGSDTDETEWETDSASDEEFRQEGSFEDNEANEANYESTSDEKSEEEESSEVEDDMEAGWLRESDERSETTEQSTGNYKLWGHLVSFVNWLKSDFT